MVTQLLSVCPTDLSVQLSVCQSVRSLWTSEGRSSAWMWEWIIDTLIRELSSQSCRCVRVEQTCMINAAPGKERFRTVQPKSQDMKDLISSNGDLIKNIHWCIEAFVYNYCGRESIFRSRSFTRCYHFVTSALGKSRLEMNTFLCNLHVFFNSCYVLIWIYTCARRAAVTGAISPICRCLRRSLCSSVIIFTQKSTKAYGTMR